MIYPIKIIWTCNRCNGLLEVSEDARYDDYDEDFTISPPEYFENGEVLCKSCYKPVWERKRHGEARYMELFG